MSYNQKKPSSVVTEKGTGPPANRAINQSKHGADQKGIEDAAKAESQNVIYVNIEDHTVAPKNQVLSDVPSRRWEDTELPPLCPRGSWKAVCCFLLLGFVVAVIFFIIDIIHHSHR